VTPPPPALDRDRAYAQIERAAFNCPAGRARMGLELEWLTVPADDPTRRPAIEEIEDLVRGTAPLAAGLGTSIEPGAQIELDTAPAHSVDAAIDLATRGEAEVRRRLRKGGIEPVALGLDPLREPKNLSRGARYEAMEARFGAQGPDGLRMMANTAALQVNVDLDPGLRRWRLANALGPPLVAAFANSALHDGAPSGWRSARLATWLRLDPARTRPVPDSSDPVATWFDYVLSAHVLLIERVGIRHAPREPLPFGRWLSDGSPFAGPNTRDLTDHLTTLFPPVRPRGWLELRYLDALDAETWPVVAALVAGLLHVDAIVERALAATGPTTGRWRMAARHGLTAEPLARAADACAELALEGLRSQGASTETIDRVRSWQAGDLADRRSPADRALARWRAERSLFPPAPGDRMAAAS